MNIRPRAPRPSRDPMSPPLPALTAVPPRPVQERRAGDAARRALVRWFGEGPAQAAVPSDN